MNLTEIKAFIKANPNAIVNVNAMSKTAIYNMEGQARYPKGTVLTFLKGSAVENHQFTNAKGEPVGVPTLCITNGSDFLSVGSLKRKAYSQPIVKEGALPSVQISHGVDEIKFNKFDGEVKDTVFYTLATDLKLTSGGNEDFVLTASSAFVDKKIVCVDGLIPTETRTCTVWNIEAV
jgi:hypothetical protein